MKTGLTLACVIFLLSNNQAVAQKLETDAPATDATVPADLMLAFARLLENDVVSLTFHQSNAPGAMLTELKSKVHTVRVPYIIETEDADGRVKRETRYRQEQRTISIPVAKWKVIREPRIDIGRLQFLTWQGEDVPDLEVKGYLEAKKPVVVIWNATVFEQLPKGVFNKDVLIVRMPDGFGRSPRSNLPTREKK